MGRLTPSTGSHSLCATSRNERPSSTTCLSSQPPKGALHDHPSRFDLQCPSLTRAAPAFLRSAEWAVYDKERRGRWHRAPISRSRAASRGSRRRRRREHTAIGTPREAWPDHRERDGSGALGASAAVRGEDGAGDNPLGLRVGARRAGTTKPAGRHAASPRAIAAGRAALNGCHATVCAARSKSLLHVKEAAAELGVHPSTVRRAIHHGELDAVLRPWWSLPRAPHRPPHASCGPSTPKETRKTSTFPTRLYGAVKLRRRVHDPRRPRPTTATLRECRGSGHRHARPARGGAVISNFFGQHLADARSTPTRRPRWARTGASSRRWSTGSARSSSTRRSTPGAARTHKPNASARSPALSGRSAPRGSRNRPLRPTPHVRVVLDLPPACLCSSSPGSWAPARSRSTRPTGTCCPTRSTGHGITLDMFLADERRRAVWALNRHSPTRDSSYLDLRKPRFRGFLCRGAEIRTRDLQSPRLAR